jgi:hypothetical protein
VTSIHADTNGAFICLLFIFFFLKKYFNSLSEILNKTLGLNVGPVLASDGDAVVGGTDDSNGLTPSRQADNSL